MATPFVSGVVTLALALDRQSENKQAPIRSVSDLRDLLSRTADQPTLPAPVAGGVWIWIPGAKVQA